MNEIRTKFRNAFNKKRQQVFGDLHEIKAMPVQFDDLNDDELYAGLDTLLPAPRSLVKHHLDSTDRFYDEGIIFIIGKVFEVDKAFTAVAEPDKVQKIHLGIQFTDAKLGKPSYRSPIDALQNDGTYAGNMSISADITITVYKHDGTTSVIKKSVQRDNICQFPIMVGSNRCHTYQKSPLFKQMNGDDPTDPGGYMIINGNSWCTLMGENIVYNEPRCFINNYKNEATRLEFISKRGDSYENSNQVILIQTVNDGIVVQIRRHQMAKIQLPFFLVFRMLGVSDDKEMFNMILQEDNYSSFAEQMDEHLTNAMYATYPEFPNANAHQTMDEAKQYVIKTIVPMAFPNIENVETDENAFRQAHEILMKYLDEHLLTHVGFADQRYEKLRFLGKLINHLIKTHNRVIPETDRDNLNNKRLHPAGITFGKQLKTHFNLSIVVPLVSQFAKNFAEFPIEGINISKIFATIDGTAFAKAMINFLKSGHKSTMITASKTKSTNHALSQLMTHKNQLNDYSNLRMIKTPETDSTKSSERAIIMRDVHATYPCKICLYHSPEGESVGINKQLPMFSTVAQMVDSSNIKRLLLEDKEDFIPIDSISFQELALRKYHHIYVNGDWVGYTKDIYKFVKKYRTIRRNSTSIDNTITIYHDTYNAVHFWCDAGRLLTLAYIVYNNIDNPELFEVTYAGPATDTFRQGILYNKQYAKMVNAGMLTLQNLFDMKIVEYVGCGEDTNCVFASSYEVLQEHNADECRLFTHCVTPQSLMGITALTSPYPHMNQSTRWTFQCNQAKATCGYYKPNAGIRTDNDTYLQFKCEAPLVQTNSTKYLYPSGNNIVMLMATYCNFNMEDSAVMNQSSIDRGLFNCCKKHSTSITYGPEQTVGIPDISKTMDTKNMSYEHLNNDGIIPVGATIRKDDIIVAMYVEIPEGGNVEYKYKDCSARWPYKEAGIVTNVIRGVNSENKQFVKIVTIKPRAVVAGDKFSSRAGQKGVVSVTLNQVDMPHTKDGVFAIIIMNPHSMPTRMTVGQLVEGIASEYGQHSATFVNATAFYQNNVEAIQAELVKMGKNKYGLERIYSGITGEMMHQEMSMNIIYYQRLQKMVKDAVHATAKATLDSMHRQPVPGKSRDGGMREGEMEMWVNAAGGIGYNLSEIIRDHSDSFDLYICATCGNRNTTVVNVDRKMYKCTQCKNHADIRKVHSCWITNLVMFHQLNAMGIGIRANLSLPVYEC